MIEHGDNLVGTFPTVHLVIDTETGSFASGKPSTYVLVMSFLLSYAAETDIFGVGRPFIMSM